MFLKLDMNAWMTMRSKINRGIFTCLILNAQMINLVFRFMTLRKEGSSVLWDKTSATSLNQSWRWSISVLCPRNLQFYFQLFLLCLCMFVYLCVYGHACVHLYVWSLWFVWYCIFTCLHALVERGLTSIWVSFLKRHQIFSGVWETVS